MAKLKPALPAALALALLLGPVWPVAAQARQGSPERRYLGYESCKQCHETQFRNFVKYSKKFRSFQHIKRMRPGLTADEFKSCFECHTTGHGRPGGFVSEQKTPGLAVPGCEVCHGPGSAHVASGGDPALIKRKLTIKDCQRCHNAERIKAFNFKPLVFGGAH